MKRRARRTALRLFLLTGVVALSGACVAGANASQLIDRNAQGIRLAVNSSGIAMVTYTKGGIAHHVLARGAINALAPDETRAQVAFKVDYAGGWGFFHKMNYWKHFRNVCRRYTGPPLAWFVTGCTMPDGSFWAIQKWQRMLPNYGLTPKARQRAWELRLSHWNTDLPVLDIHLDWIYHQHFTHLWGLFTYLDQAVYGFDNTLYGAPTDSWGRNIYVDTFNSRYGKGWKRENSFLTHKPTGGFCYGFFSHSARGTSRPPGNGTKYRATVIGPGVTPDAFWQGTAVSYDPQIDAQENAERLAALGNDSRCANY